MNNDNNQNNNNNIDDILDILQKRKAQDIMSGNTKDDAPTRIDHTVVKKPSQSSSFSLSSQSFATQDTPQKTSQQPQERKPSALPPVTACAHAPAMPPQGPVRSTPVSASPSHMNGATKQVPINAPLPKATPIKASSVQPAAPKPVTPPVTNSQPAPLSDKPAVPNGEVPAPKTPASPAPASSAAQAQGSASQRPSNAAPVSRPANSGITKPAVQKPKASAVSSAPKPTGGTISLSDFDDREVEKAARKADRKKNKKKSGLPGWLKLVIYLLVVISISVLISLTVIKVANDVFAFVKPDKEITIEIEEGATLKEVAQILKDAQVIEYPWIFEQFSAYRISKRSYLTSDFTPGEHVLKPNMNYDKIIASLCVSAYDKSVVRITIPEGYTFNEIMNLFIENGVMKEEDRDEYLTQLQEFDYEYNFITKLGEQGSLDNEDRIHRLEGYLFPDTYDFYKNENPTAALDKLLDNFEKKFTEDMYERADKLGMTMDEVITLASMIEAEGDSPANFGNISSVFHNRLNDRSGTFKYLGSDATTLYAYRIAGYDKKTLGGGETDFDHPYNTYTNIGLPPGPICNPGIEAIYAALYPEDTNYYYFLTMANGETVFAQTLSQHNANIAKSNKIAEEIKAKAEEEARLKAEQEAQKKEQSDD